MSSSIGPGLIEDGLVFYYDMENAEKSWKGKPTTNLYGDAVDYNSGLANGRWYNLNTSEKSIQLSSTYANWCVRFPATLSSNTQYTLSFQYKSDVSGSTFVIDNDGVDDNTWNATITANADWQTYTYTRTNVTAGAMSMYFRRNSGGNIYIKKVQIEANSFATPFVNGTRSNTQAILDLTGNNTITASSLTYNSDGSFEFNGSSDYLSFNPNITFKTSGGWSVESWVKFDTVADAYNNTTSPANLIGSDVITYNSWYWSVFNKKLALWNRDPGTWRYGSTILQSNVWYNTVLVCYDSGTSYQMYLNGAAEAGDHISYSWNAAYSGLIIGNIGMGNASNPRRLDGKIAQTKVYNRALSAAEVKRNFNAIKWRYGL